MCFLTMVILIILCFRAMYTIVFANPWLQLCITSYTWYHWQILWGRTWQRRIAQFQQELALVYYTCPYKINKVLLNVNLNTTKDEIKSNKLTSFTITRLSILNKNNPTWALEHFFNFLGNFKIVLQKIKTKLLATQLKKWIRKQC